MKKKREGDVNARGKIDSSQPPTQSKTDKPGLLATAEGLTPILIDRHRQLTVNQQEIFQRVNANPELSKLFLINPILALKELGVTFTPEITDHVLRSVRHPPSLLKRREELEQKLREALKEEAKPNDPKWVSGFLFTRLKLKPRDTSQKEPAYLEPLNAEILRHLQARRPKLRQRPKGERPRAGTVLSVAVWRPAVRRMDLNAKLPELKPALGTVPEQVKLEELYFYKDHPLAHDLLELGILQLRGFPIHSADSFRKIRSGEKRNAFNSWIKKVTFTDKPK